MSEVKLTRIQTLNNNSDCLHVYSEVYVYSEVCTTCTCCYVCTVPDC